MNAVAPASPVGEVARAVAVLVARDHHTEVRPLRDRHGPDREGQRLTEADAGDGKAVMRPRSPGVR